VGEHGIDGHAPLVFLVEAIFKETDMNKGLYDNVPQMVLESRPAAIRFASEIGDFANKTWGNLGGNYAMMIGCITIQTIITSLVISKYPPGSTEGEALIREMYDAMSKDAVKRWHERDLKHWYGNKNEQKS
jgi:hypothetical protein